MRQLPVAFLIIVSMILLNACNKTPVTRELPGTPGGTIPPSTYQAAPASQEPYIGIRDDANDPYVKAAAGKQITIDGILNYYSPILGIYTYDQQNDLIQVTEFGAIFRNFVFTYDAQGERQHNRWKYFYDPAGAISKIEISSPTTTRTYNVTSNTLVQYTEARDSETLVYKYEYNSSGDPHTISCTHTLLGFVHEYVYNLTYTDELSNLNNDPMFHFGNLSFWFSIPIVSKHLLSTMSYIDNGAANAPFNWSSLENNVTRNLMYHYDFDAKHRPISIVAYDMNLSSDSISHFEISYP
ncbi:MAG: hypothetical protein ACHQET_14120 [Chitinophagales bacterium]